MRGEFDLDGGAAATFRLQLVTRLVEIRERGGETRAGILGVEFGAHSPTIGDGDGVLGRGGGLGGLGGRRGNAARAVYGDVHVRGRGRDDGVVDAGLRGRAVGGVASRGGELALEFRAERRLHARAGGRLDGGVLGRVRELLRLGDAKGGVFLHLEGTTLGRVRACVRGVHLELAARGGTRGGFAKLRAQHHLGSLLATHHLRGTARRRALHEVHRVARSARTRHR